MDADFSFPHPVLGINDDMSGEFDVEISISRDSEKREIIFSFNKLVITNQYIDDLINNEDAGPYVKIYCSSTMKTWTFYNKSKMAIDEDEIINHVEIDVRILSMKDGLEYYDDTFNKEYNSQRFKVNKKDTLAILETERVPIPKENEKLGLGNIFKFRTHKIVGKPLEINVNNDEFIEITYPPVNDEHPHQFMFKKYPWTAYNIFILPALEEALKFIEENKSTASHYRWYVIIDKLLPESDRTGNHFNDAQLLLDGEVPLIKSYKEISKN